MDFRAALQEVFSRRDFSRPLREEFSSLELVEIVVMLEEARGKRLPDEFLLEIQNLSVDAIIQRML